MGSVASVAFPTFTFSSWVSTSDPVTPDGNKPGLDESSVQNPSHRVQQEPDEGTWSFHPSSFQTRFIPFGVAGAYPHSLLGEGGIPPEGLQSITDKCHTISWDSNQSRLAVW